MADFLLIVGPKAARQRWEQTGLRSAEALRLGRPVHSHGGEVVACHAFARRDGSRPLVSEGADRCLLNLGTWRGPSGSSGPFEIEDRSCSGFGVLLELRADGARLCTDPIASHQVHVRRGHDCIAVSSSALILSALDDDDFDVVGCQELVSTGILYEDRTPWRSVSRLDPDSVYEIRPDGIDRRDADRLRIPATCDLEGPQAVEAVVSGLRDTADRLREQPGLVADLTGGWDSRLLIAALLDRGVSFETTVTGPSDSADVRIAESIAAEFGFVHRSLPPMAAPSFDELERAIDLGEGEVNPIAYARILRVHETLSRDYSMSLNGSFGEVARGYWWEILNPGPSAVRPVEAQVIAERRYAAGAIDLGLWPTGQRLDLVAHFRAMIEKIDASADPRAPQGLRLDRTYLGMRMRSWQGRIATTTDRLWPCLSPLIFPGVLQPLLATRPRDRAHDRLVRHVLVALNPKLARHRLENGGPAVPMTATNLWRFTPMAVGLGRRALRKFLGRARPGKNPEEMDTPRLELLADERVQHLFDPGSMLTATMFDEQGLTAFVRALGSNEFVHEQPFGRLLGLEMAARRRAELVRLSAQPTGSR